MQIVRPAVHDLMKMPEPQRSEKIAEAFSTALEHLVDQEVMYQDAIKKLEKGNKSALDKLKELVEQDYEKQVKKMREGGVPEEYISGGSARWPTDAGAQPDFAGIRAQPDHGAY